MNILFIKYFFGGFMVTEIPRVSVFRTVRIRLLSPTHYFYIFEQCLPMRIQYTPDHITHILDLIFKEI